MSNTGKNIYVGNRYVPKLFNDGNGGSQWRNNVEFESLTVVMNQGNSYTSKQKVPIGIDIGNILFWVKTADYNAQVAIYEQNVRDYHQYVIDQIGIVNSDFNDFVTTQTNNFNTFESTQLDNFNEYTNSIDSKVLDIVTIKPSGDATTDTTNIQNAFNNARNVTFANIKNQPFLLSNVINIEPIDETISNGSFNGRIINFNNCIIKATNNISNCFIFKSHAFPLNMRNYEVSNVIFDGIVSDSFIMIENSNAWYNKFKNIKSTLSAKANSLLKLKNTETFYQGGLNTFRHIYSFNLVKHGIEFEIGSGANNLFDDLIIEDVSSIYLGEDNISGDNNPSIEDGACLYLKTGAIVSMSKISRLFFGGYGHIINGENNTTITRCDIKNLYGENKSTNSYGIYRCVIDRCTINIIRLYLVKTSTVTTRARCIYAITIQSTISNLYIDESSGITNSIFYEEVVGSNSNSLSNIGENALSRISLQTTDVTTVVNQDYNQQYKYTKFGDVANASDNISKTINLINLSKAEIHSTGALRIKIKGECNGNTLNVFKLQLSGTGITSDLLNYVSTSNANVFEVETDIVVRSASTIGVISRSIIGNTIVNNTTAGTPLYGALTTSDPLKVVLNITNSSYIGILSITVEKINTIIKPLYGYSYGQ